MIIKHQYYDFPRQRIKLKETSRNSTKAGTTHSPDMLNGEVVVEIVERYEQIKL